MHHSDAQKPPRASPCAGNLFIQHLLHRPSATETAAMKQSHTTEVYPPETNQPLPFFYHTRLPFATSTSVAAFEHSHLTKATSTGKPSNPTTPTDTPIHTNHGTTPAYRQPWQAACLTGVEDEIPIQRSEVKVTAGALHPLAPHLAQAFAALVHPNHLYRESTAISTHHSKTGVGHYYHQAR